MVQKLIDENPASFCKSLGEGYSYIESQYKIKIGSTIKYDLYTYKPIGKITNVTSAGVKVASKGDDAADVLYALFSTK